jgi:hypothetical protein
MPKERIHLAVASSVPLVFTLPVGYADILSLPTLVAQVQEHGIRPSARCLLDNADSIGRIYTILVSFL